MEDGRMLEVSSKGIKNLLAEEGIDLVGIADARCLLLSYPARPASELVATARSVVVMAVAHNRSAVEAPYLKLWTRNKMQTSRLLDAAAEKAARLLERASYLSLPISADKPVEIYKQDPSSGRRLPHTRVAGHLSLKHAAVSAGLGEIGRCNLLLTPEFGPHQRLGAIVTSATLEPDPRKEMHLCTDCGRCDSACPVGALRGGRHAVDPCFDYWTYGFDHMRPRRPGQWPAYLRMLLGHLRRRDLLVETGQTYITDVDNCIACMKACPVGERWKALGRDCR
jgi:epoxyqueuosine reductase